MGRINLNKEWKLKDYPLSYKKDMAAFVLADNSDWYTGRSLPTDIHTPLIDAGVIKDPIVADYSFESEWVEQRSWWFKKSFNIESCDAPYYRLVLESLDVHADIFFNGVYLGHQASAFYPFECDIKAYVVKGNNVLLVRLTSGLEYVSDLDLAETELKMGTDQSEGRGDNRRVYARKPAYVYGWDWNPRIPSIAIARNAYIEYSFGVKLNFVNVETVSIGDPARIRAKLEVESLNQFETIDADISVKVMLDDELKAFSEVKDKLICSGLNYITFDLDISNPSLWWPNGMGKQPLYELYISITYDKNKTLFSSSKFGIRTVKLDLSKTDEKNRRFNFNVNGVSVFCKGANWVPADSVYTRVSYEKYETLIKEAAEANFNMLRVWGGGVYERDEFYDMCDKYGILLWHDFMFSGASYPDNIEWYYDLICKELDYQTKRLGGRTCIALFCGNNEIQCNPHLFKSFGMKIFNIAAPEYVNKNCPKIPY